MLIVKIIKNVQCARRFELIFILSQNCSCYFNVINIFSTFFDQFINYFFSAFTIFIMSPTSHDLWYSHSQLLGFQIIPLSHASLSTNSWHSHFHLSLFQRCLLLQTLALNLHSDLHVSWNSIYLVSLILDFRLNILLLMFSITS